MSDFTISGLSVKAQCGSNTDAHECPTGQSFEIHATGTVVNTNPGLTDWTTCMTVYDITHGKAIGFKNDSLGHGTSDKFSLAINLVMPATDTRYRVKIFATQHKTLTSPDQSRW